MLEPIGLHDVTCLALLRKCRSATVLFTPATGSSVFQTQAMVHANVHSDSVAMVPTYVQDWMSRRWRQ